MIELFQTQFVKHCRLINDFLNLMLAHSLAKSINLSFYCHTKAINKNCIGQQLVLKVNHRGRSIVVIASKNGEA